LAEASLADDHEVYFRVIALLRLLNPRAHIPATTAFDAVFAHGRDQALERGANVFMPNLTPKPYRDKYLLYPNKPGVDEAPEAVTRKVIARLRRLGRPIGTGPGHSLRTGSGGQPGGRRRVKA
jgi:biotin synthase